MTPRKHIKMTKNTKQVVNNLTPQQEKFAQAVAIGKTYADAYRDAYHTENMKDNTIYVNSSVLMSDNKIIIRVNELRNATVKRNEVTLDEVLQEMANWLRFDVKSIFNDDGTMKPLKEMTNQESSSIAQYECVELFDGSGDKRTHIGYLKKVKIIDKRAVAEMFLKKFGAFITKVVVDNEDLNHIKELLDGIKE